MTSWPGPSWACLLRWEEEGCFSAADTALPAYLGSLSQTAQLISAILDGAAPDPLTSIDALADQFWAGLGTQPSLPASSSQAKYTEVLMKHKHTQLLAAVASAPGVAEPVRIRQKARLMSLTNSSSTAFLRAAPLRAMGLEMDAQEFRTALRWLLGLPVVPEVFLCPLCGSLFDTYGDHAVMCGSG